MSRRPQGDEAKGSHSKWVTFALFATAVVLWLNPIPFTSPVPAAGRTPSWATDTTPVRQPKLAPFYLSGVYAYKCSDCHKILPSPPQTYRKLGQHTEIQLEHGVNTRCFNCHHRTNRDAFVDDAGGEIAWDQPQLLCGKCHGPVYRDWQNGAHGRTNGYWDLSQGQQTRRKCIECHDPHHPAFEAIRPAAGPHTLRMGPQDSTARDHRYNPLQVNGNVSPEGPHQEAAEGH